MAQALLFYGKVQLMLDSRAVIRLIRQLGPRTLLDVLRRPDISATYSSELLGVVTNTYSGMEYHAFAAFSLRGHEGTKLKNDEEALHFELVRNGFDRSIARAFCAGFFKAVTPRALTGKHFVHDGITNAVRREFNQKSFILDAFRQVVSSIAPTYRLPNELELNLIDNDLGFAASNNIDWQELDANYKYRPTAQDKITLALILSHIQDSIADLLFASHYGGDFFTSEISSSIARIKLKTLSNKATDNQRRQTEFHELLFPDLPTVEEVIDSGERDFKEFLKILKKGRKFKDWLAASSPDEGLVREYINAQARTHWSEKAPTKVARFLFTTLLDASIAPKNPLDPMGPAGFLDSLLGDRILGGWRPNHFIDGRLRPFLKA